MADHVQIAREYFPELENGRKQIGVRSLERIADALEVRLNEFCEDE